MFNFRITFIVTIMFTLVAVPKAYAILASELDTVVVTATRIDQDSYKLAGNVSVITREEIENSNAQTVPDLLREAQGVYIYDNSTAKSSTVDIRGFGDTASRNVLVLVNGRRQNLVSITGPDLVQLPISAIERVEIIRGAGSVLYGDNAVGGVINIITKKGEGEFSGELGGLYGSYDTQGADFEISGNHKGVGLYFYTKYLDKRGYRANSDELYKDFNARVDYQVTDKISIDIEAGHHDDTVDLPGGLDQTELVTFGRRGSADSGNVATTKDTYYRFTLDVDPMPEETYLGRFVFDFNYRDRSAFDSFGAFAFNTDRDVESKGLTGKYIFDQTIFDREVSFVTGIDYYEHENEILGSGSNSDDLTISKDEFGAYGFMQFETLPNLFINGGGRYHKAEYTFNQRNIVNFEKRKPDESVFMGGAKYEYAKGSNIHLNWQQTFRFLATNEWYSSFSGLNTDIEQQSGVQYEAGIKHNFKDKMIVNVTPYWIENKNEIYFNPTGGSFGFGANENYDETRRVGVEFGSIIDVLDVLDLEDVVPLNTLEFFANYTYQDPEFSEGANDGNKIPLVPMHQATHGISTRFLENFYVTITGRYIGERYILNDVANLIDPAKPYYVLDTKWSFRNEDFEAYVAVNNTTNEIYSTFDARKTATLKDIYPAPERNYLFGINVKF